MNEKMPRIDSASRFLDVCNWGDEMQDRWDRLDKKGWQKANKIGKTAARLFSRKGYLKTSMDEIAAAAKISKGGMYYYFQSKTEVLFFILSKYMDLVLQDLEKDLSQEKISTDKLKFIISRHIKLYSNNSSEAKVLLHEAHCLPKKHFEVIAEKQRTYFQIASEVLLEVFEYPIPKDRLTALTFTLFGMCNWIYSWYDPKGAVGPEELSQTIWTLFINGVHEYRAQLIKGS